MLNNFDVIAFEEVGMPVSYREQMRTTVQNE
jgi:hypothetical protein